MYRYVYFRYSMTLDLMYQLVYYFLLFSNRCLFYISLIPMTASETEDQCLETQGTGNSQSYPEERNQAGGITIPDLKTCNRAVVIRTVWYQHRKDQWNEIETSKESPYIHSQLMFNKRTESNSGKMFVLLGQLDRCLHS